MANAGASRRNPTAASSQTEGPISRRSANERIPIWVALILGVAFVLPGLFSLWNNGIQPIRQTLYAMTWPEVPAVILESQLVRYPGAGRNLYRLEIRFEYTWNGQRFVGDRFDFDQTVYSDSERKFKIISEYPVGHAFPVRVNPKAPEIAVIRPKLHWGFVQSMGFGMMSVAVGGGVIVYVFSSRWPLFFLHGKTAADSSLPLPEMPDEPGSVQLKAGSRPWISFGGWLILSLAWNLPLGLWGMRVVQSWKEGRGGFMLVLFVVLLVFIGISMLVSAWLHLLMALTPRVRLRLTPGDPRPGESVSLDWKMGGSSARFRSFQILLEGVEEARSVQGTTMQTDARVFFRKTLVCHDDPAAIQSGTVDMEMPGRVMHSWKGEYNQIYWRFRVRGDLAARPELCENYAFILLPVGEDQKKSP